MVQIIRDRPGFGEVLGTGLGSGIGSALQGLAQGKVQAMENKQSILKNKMALMGMGVPEDKATALSMLDPKAFQEVIKQTMIAPKREAVEGASRRIADRDRGIVSQDITPNQQEVDGAKQEPLTAEAINKESVELNNIISEAAAAGGTREELKDLRQQATDRTNSMWKQLESQQKEDRFKENLSIQREKAAAPYLSDLREKIAPVRDLNRVTDEILDSLEDPNLQLGSIKSLIANRFQNAPTQKFLAKINELVSLKLQMGKGLPTKLRIALEQAAKPQQYQTKQTIADLTTSIKDGIRELSYEEDVKDQIIAESGNMFPNSLEQKVKRRYKLTKDLPDPTGYSEGAILEDDENGKKYARTGLTWLPL